MDALVVVQDVDSAAHKSKAPIGGWRAKQVKYLADKVGDVAVTDVYVIVDKYLGRKVKAPDVKEWTPSMLSSISTQECRTVITLGAPACKWFFPKGKFGELRGKHQAWTHPETGDIYDVIPMYDPSACRPGVSPGLHVQMESDWRGLTKEGKPGTYSRVTADAAQLLFASHFQTPFAFDFETKLNHWPELGVSESNGFELDKRKDYTFQAVRAQPIGWSFCFEEGVAYYCTDSIESISGPLQDANWKKYVHNALFEFAVCKNVGITLRGYHDTKIMAFLLGEPSSHLKDLSATLLGIRQTRFDEVNWDNIEEVTQYGAADSDYTLRIRNILEPRLSSAERLLSVYTLIDLPSVETLSDAQRDGFLVDTTRLAGLRHDLEVEFKSIKTYLVGEHGHDINLSSPDAIAEWLYSPVDSAGFLPTNELKTRTHIRYKPSGLGLPVLSTTEGGKPQTNINTLHLLDHPVADALIKYSSLEQFLGGHCRNFLFLPQEDGRIHPSYNLSGHWEVDDQDKTKAPSTGRVSSTGPNAQQVTNYGDDSRPYVFEWGQALRRCIQPAPGFVFLEADFAQQEPRIAAMVSGDTFMDHLLQTADVYRPAAADLYKIYLEGVNKDQRQIGKRAWMAWLNRAGAAGIKRSAWWLTKEEADEWLAVQHERYNIFTAWCGDTFRFLKKHGYVETWYGRRISLPSVHSPLSHDQEAAYRACIPGVIQGTGADVFKLCLKEAGPYIHSIGGRTPLLIHDAIVAEVPEERAQDAVNYLKAMSEGMMSSPLPIEVMWGFNWSKLDMKEVFAT